MALKFLGVDKKAKKMKVIIIRCLCGRGCL